MPPIHWITESSPASWLVKAEVRNVKIARAIIDSIDGLLSFIN